MITKLTPTKTIFVEQTLRESKQYAKLKSEQDEYWKIRRIDEIAKDYKPSQFFESMKGK